MAGPNQSLQQSQSQSLVMTQALQQSIKLLQLSSLDLQEFVAGEMEKNPLLQEADSQQSTAAEGETKSENDATDTEQHRASDDAAPADLSSDTVKAEYADRGERTQPEYKQTGNTSSSGSSAASENLIEKLAHEKPNLRQHLIDHLNQSTQNMTERAIGLHLIDGVSAAGYVAPDYLELGDLLQCEADDIDKIVILLQQCEPAGICARNLAECLRLQLEDQGEDTEAMRALVANLDLLGKAEYKKLASQCGVPHDELAEMVQLLKTLNPKPGYAFDFEEVQAVAPDVFVRQRDRDWEIELNPGTLPKVLVNNDYFVRLSESSRDKDDKSYLSEQMAHANWLVKSLDQRAQTILKTTREIVKQQANFFRHGVRYLKPLTLREVADAIEMHESTISRITSNKYLSHNGTLYELKYFFNSSIGSSFGGDDISSKAVQAAIENLIAQETNAKNVLSDEAIAEKLNHEGMNIARRTVAKYRDILKIPSSAQRKRTFKAQI